jgi:inorganic pyrophosphatase
MPDFLSLPTFASPKEIHVVVETPRFARAKFKYEPKLGVFMLSRPLTLGLSYQFDWGFVPSTVAPDGDPIDALVLHNITTNPGMMLKCRPIGVRRSRRRNSEEAEAPRLARATRRVGVYQARAKGLRQGAAAELGIARGWS